MAEAIVLSVIKSISSIIADTALTKLTSLIKVHSRLEHIKSIFEVMSGSLKDIDEMNDYNHAVAAWRKQVIDVAYEVEDIVDEYSYLTRERHQKDFKGVFYKVIHVSRDARTWYQTALHLKNLETKLENLTNMRNQFGINTCQGMTIGNNSNDDTRQISRFAESSHFKLENEIIGIEENRNLIENWLADNETSQYVIAAWGMAGVGKTTLATNVYNRQKKECRFSNFSWISVTQTYNINDLLRNIILELYEGKMEATPQSFNTMDYRHLVQILQGFLHQKKYLIILDDIWSTEVWTYLKNAFLDCKLGSRVIITTRVYDVAINAASKSHIIELKPLQKDKAQMLFCHTVFGEGTIKYPHDLEELAQKFLRKCEGLPLAIVCIGRLLSIKDKDIILWQRIYDGLNIGSTDLRNVYSIFRLSFNDLPSYLKSCLLYCSMFPEGHMIRRNKLIRLWVAEGFVQKQGSKSMEEMAEEYLNELTHRCMLKTAHITSMGIISRYVIHDLIRDFLLKKSREDNFCEVYRGSELCGDIRRLSISSSANDLRLETSHHLRSIIVFDPKALFSNLTLQNYFSSFRLLKVLDMSFSPIEKLPNEIYQLFNLHYLALRGTKIKKISKSLGRLQNLQTLDVWNTYVENLPSTIAKLKRLRNICAGKKKILSGNHFVRYAVTASRKICDLAYLQTIKYLAANDEIVKQIGNLAELRSLDIGRVTESQSEELFVVLSKMERLKKLSVHQHSESVLSFNFEAFPSLPPYLQKLNLHAIFAKGKLPQWFLGLVHLQSVILYFSGLSEDSLPFLGLLPNLLLLELGDDAYVGQRLCLQECWFPKLRNLRLIKLVELNCLEIRRDAMPALFRVYLKACEELQIVQGMENLPSLSELVLDKMPNVFRNSLHNLPDNIKIKVVKNWTERDGIWSYQVSNN
ncbi:disease resistance protein RPM1-like [Dendrobium catenatum]|uniref:Disease resistance protein RPM1 n=1 Tax=Dendrobium catenatum TaxID=906689 RepID=A0A2I0XAA5_9ASPA|nr:disease resistance protein RPM1-like [Dendrobium catenatum]XP_020674924.1 disease resistance protein RPM1-like [Dendrobium catenatum]XP_020674925.1 disease resistance protein RPM1-like [Dendrobium catenatum]PKU84832.1 Disease resistance protein RPM1 [Dendrobium catenatum]